MKAIMSCIAVLAGAMGVAAGAAAGNSSLAPLTIDAVAALPAPETITGVEYDVKTSSVLREKNRDYRPANMASFDPAKAWCEGSPSNGVGEWIELSLKGKPRAAVIGTIELKILPGYAATDQLYQANARPARIVVETFDQTTRQPVSGQNAYIFNLADGPFLQVLSIDVGRSVEPSKIVLKIKIDDVFKGDKFEDMCITEIQVVAKERGRGILELKHEERDVLSNKEIDYLKRQLPKAERGNKEAMQGLIRLVIGAYNTSVEGSEWLNEIYFDLLIKHPYQFLFLLTRQEPAVRNKIVEEELLKPVSDKYSQKELLAAVKAAKAKGLNPPFFKMLIDFYSTL